MKALIYQMLPRYWGGYQGKNVRGGSLEENGCGHFEDIDDRSLEYISSLGMTHVWFTGVIRHSTSCNICGCTPSHPQIVKGAAGSPYAISDYYDVNPYLSTDPDARMKEFGQLVERTHAHGLKVILDFVPNHVSRDNVNFGQDDDKSVHWAPENDFFYYPGQSLSLPGEFTPTDDFPHTWDECPARATGNNCFCSSPSSNDWYETVKINYCDFHTRTWDKMTDILKFWAARGVDGFRCDMIELVPSEFLEYAISAVRKEYPDVIFIGEVYDRDNYRPYVDQVGFDLLYDKSGLYDQLRNIVAKNVSDDYSMVELWQSTRQITANWQRLDNLQDHMLNFLENHDEQRLASANFALSAQGGYAALAVSLLFNNSSFMLYFGQEVGEKGDCEEGFSGRDSRTSIFDWWSIESLRSLYMHIHSSAELRTDRLEVLERYRSILHLCRRQPFIDGLNYDLCFCNMSSRGFDPDRHFAFLRYNDDICCLVVCNFSQKKADMTIDIPLYGCSRDVIVPPCDFTVMEL